MDNVTLEPLDLLLHDLQHPFYPLDLKLPEYVANDMSTVALLLIFAAECTMVASLTNVLARRVRPSTTTGELWAATWFMICGFIHLFFEGYFSYNNAQMASRTHLFGQQWKEYAMSDHRYMTRDSFVVCMESMTAFLWGPLSFVIGWCIIKDHPLRHPLQLIVSVGQLYGVILYYVTVFFDEAVFGKVFGRPEGYYFWAYFIGTNAFWFFIPLWLIVLSVLESVKAFRQMSERRDYILMKTL